MRARFTLALICVLLVCSLATLRAQGAPDAQLWLTTSDRSALFALQDAHLHFAKTQDEPSTVEVNDMQQFQPIDGFGFALTGGSAQLLMHM